MTTPTPTVVNNIRIQYITLCEEVQGILCTRVGNVNELQGERDRVLQFLQYAQPVRIFYYPGDTIVFLTWLVQHSTSFDASEWSTLTSSIQTMVSELDNACIREADPTDDEPLNILSSVRTGRRGRPKIEISPSFLAEASAHRGPTGIGRSIGVRARTVRQQQLDYGLAILQLPVFENHIQPDGEVIQYRNEPPPRPQQVTDEELDAIIREILERFPLYGRSMLDGQLNSMGYNITRARARASYGRVNGVPHVFGDRRIHRRTYKVAGANALWHHDGQHGE